MLRLQASVERSIQNPLLKPLPNVSWANTKVYNPTVVVDVNGVYHMLFRAVGSDSRSRLGYASSLDGTRFDVNHVPVLEPWEPFAVEGCEDPRLTRIEEVYWLSYTAFEGRTARIALTTTRDFHKWAQPCLMLPDWSEGLWNQAEMRSKILPGFDASTWSPDDAHWTKAAALFPEKIQGKYWAYFGEDQVWCASSAHLTKHWSVIPSPILRPRPGCFDAAYLEMGPAPIKLPMGWLIIYNGVDALDQQRVYRVGAAVCALDDPTKILWRAEAPILEPEREYEVTGTIDVADPTSQEPHHTDLSVRTSTNDGPLAVFCCGATYSGLAPDNTHRVELYYGAADRLICMASAKFMAI